MRSIKIIIFPIVAWMIFLVSTSFLLTKNGAPKPELIISLLAKSCLKYKSMRDSFFLVFRMLLMLNTSRGLCFTISNC